MIYCARISGASEVMTGAVWLLLALKAGLKTFRRNLSAAACMDYTSPTTARMSEPRSGASCRAVVEISECNSYASQRLDSLRSDFFLFKCAVQVTIVCEVAVIGECKTYTSQHLDSLRVSKPAFS